MAATQSMFEMAVLAKLNEITTKLEKMDINMGLNATETRDILTKAIRDEVTASVTAAKEKKKIAATEAKAGEEKKAASAKKTHPSLGEVTDAAWNLGKTGDDYEKRLNWFISVLSKHPTHLHALIGTDEVARINNSTDYKYNLSQQKKSGEREKAKVFLATLKKITTGEGTFDALSKKMVADYDTQLAILNSQKIGQLSSEAASAAESAAATALAGLMPVVGQPVVVHAAPTAVAGVAAAQVPPVTTAVPPSEQLAVVN